LSFYNTIKSFGVTISLSVIMYLWLHIQSAINMDVLMWIYRYYIVDMLNILNDGLTHLLMLVLRWSGVYWVTVGVGLCDVLFRLERIVGVVHWSSAHRSISSVVEFACTMTPNSLFFHYYMFLIIAWYVPDSCLLLRMCNVYAEVGLFALIYVHGILFLLIPSLTDIWFVSCFAL
jgi:hypothetical protein